MVDPALYDEYSKEKVDEAIAYLSYKKAENPRPLPKEESGKHPILYVFRHSQSEDNADLYLAVLEILRLQKKVLNRQGFWQKN